MHARLTGNGRARQARRGVARCPLAWFNSSSAALRAAASAPTHAPRQAHNWCKSMLVVGSYGLSAFAGRQAARSTYNLYAINTLRELLPCPASSWRPRETRTHLGISLHTNLRAGGSSATAQLLPSGCMCIYYKAAHRPAARPALEAGASARAQTRTRPLATESAVRRALTMK